MKKGGFLRPSCYCQHLDQRCPSGRYLERGMHWRSGHALSFPCSCQRLECLKALHRGRLSEHGNASQDEPYTAKNTIFHYFPLRRPSAVNRWTGLYSLATQQKTQQEKIAILHTSVARLCSRDRTRGQSGRGRGWAGGRSTRTPPACWDTGKTTRALLILGRHVRQPPGSWR